MIAKKMIVKRKRTKKVTLILKRKRISRVMFMTRMERTWMVVTIMRKVLESLQALIWRGIQEKQVMVKKMMMMKMS